MTAFLQAFDSEFHSIMRWSQWESFVALLKTRNDGAWYVYMVGNPAPVAPASSAQFLRLLDEIDVLLRNEHKESYLGIVYVDDHEHPAMVKIFDPHHLGTSCGSSKTRILPGWVLSRLPPEDLGLNANLPGARKRWWQQIFA